MRSQLTGKYPVANSEQTNKKIVKNKIYSLMQYKNKILCVE